MILFGLRVKLALVGGRFRTWQICRLPSSLYITHKVLLSRSIAVTGPLSSRAAKNDDFSSYRFVSRLRNVRRYLQYAVRSCIHCVSSTHSNITCGCSSTNDFCILISNVAPPILDGHSEWRSCKDASLMHSLFIRLVGLVA